jgi:hypothetical protein
MQQYAENLSEVPVLLTDGGYTGDGVSTLIGALVQVVKRSELHTFQSFLSVGWLKDRSLG